VAEPDALVCILGGGTFGATGDWSIAAQKAVA